MKDIDYIFENTYPGLIPRVCKSNADLNRAILTFADDKGHQDKSYSEKIYMYKHKLTAPPVCACGKPVKYLALMRGYNKYCSSSCMHARADATLKSRSTKKQRYNDENYSAPEKRKGWFSKKSTEEQSAINRKREETSLKRYGTLTPLKNDEVKAKALETVLKKYGEIHHMKDSSVKARRAALHAEKYGVENPFQRQEIKDKIRSETMELHGVEYQTQIPAVKDKIASTIFSRSVDDIFSNRDITPLFSREDLTRFDNKTEYKWQCNRCNFTFLQRFSTTRRRPFCTKCDSVHIGSVGEKEVAEYVAELGFNLITNHRFTHNGVSRELDIFVPELNIGIEFNGVYWHSDRIRKKDYHLEKMNFFSEQGITILFVWENDWKLKKQLIKDRIAHKLGVSTKQRIYARDCEIKQVSNKDYREFLERYHYQSWANSKIIYGLFHGNELVSVMGFSKTSSRSGIGNNKYEYELVRFCSSHVVVGAMSKLFKHFVREHCPASIITYSLNDFNSGNGYTKLGFVEKSTTPPSYWYIDYKGVRHHRYAFNKKKLVMQGYDENLTEFDIMNELPYYRVYDTGNKIFTWDIKNGPNTEEDI